MKKFYFFTICFISISCFAKEYQNIQRSPQALFMGDAFTAVADDAYTLFYNPAALGRHEGLSIHLLNPKISVVNALSEMDRFKDFPSSDPVAIADRALGLPIYLGLGGIPTIKLQHFGISYFADLNTSLELRNAVHPIFDINFNYDRGIAVGYAFTFGNGGHSGSGRTRQAKSKKSTAGRRISVGLGIKSMNRQGINKGFDLFGLELLNKINSSGSDFATLKKSLGYSEGSAYGFDLGSEVLWSWSSSQFVVASALQDIGDTKFSLSSGTQKLPSQLMSWNTGVAFTQDFTIIDYTLSFDLHHINQPIPTASKVHFGARLGIPFVDVMFGWSAGYISYGLSVDLFLVSLYAGFYSIELGSRYLQHKSQRAVISINIIDFSFSP